MNLSYSDLMTQWELRMILCISLDMEVPPYRSNNEKFILVELRNCTLISKDFYEKFVMDKNPRYTGPEPVIQGCDPS